MNQLRFCGTAALGSKENGTSGLDEFGGAFTATERFQKDDTGATAVEFAMVGPLFFLMLGVTLETGVMMFSEYVLQTSVQEAARIVRTGQAQTSSNVSCPVQGKDL